MRERERERERERARERERERERGRERESDREGEVRERGETGHLQSTKYAYTSRGEGERHRRDRSFMPVILPSSHLVA